MGASLVKRLHVVLIGACVGCGVMAATGCQSASNADGMVTIQLEDESGRILEARSLALRAQKTKSVTEAIALYRQSISVYRELPSAWNNLGILLMDQERYLDAAEAFTTASELEPSDPRPLYNLGLTWEGAGYLSDALQYYGEALKRDPRYQPALRGAIRADRLLGRANDETLRRLRIALGQEQDKEWRAWFEMQRPQVEAEVYAKGEVESMQ
jgi:tetratricopeptide (TPR) repeat protein